MHPDDVRRDFSHIVARVSNGTDVDGPTLLTIHPTDVCNHRCPWCWFDRTSASVDMRRTIHTVDALVASGITEVIVSGGGEPLLHRDIQSLLEFLAANKRCTDVCTRMETF